MVDKQVLFIDKYPLKLLCLYGCVCTCTKYAYIVIKNRILTMSKKYEIKNC